MPTAESLTFHFASKVVFNKGSRVRAALQLSCERLKDPRVSKTVVQKWREKIPWHVMTCTFETSSSSYDIYSSAEIHGRLALWPFKAELFFHKIVDTRCGVELTKLADEDYHRNSSVDSARSLDQLYLASSSSNPEHQLKLNHGCKALLCLALTSYTVFFYFIFLS